MWAMMLKLRMTWIGVVELRYVRAQAPRFAGGPAQNSLQVWQVDDLRSDHRTQTGFPLYTTFLLLLHYLENDSQPITRSNAGWQEVKREYEEVALSGEALAISSVMAWVLSFTGLALDSDQFRHYFLVYVLAYSLEAPLPRLRQWGSLRSQDQC